ncbi:Osmotically-inducible protein Y [Paraburkholderia humisilvae]|uniref:Osmotically-inducible protein Y n=1 Tax=Paraburkholderia humisilvae TaxID=627669 RepID=A0A6J5EXJ0_9BURK|nr:Osmotically-inducible protein Y [Paraburkholderia humisilvae]
MNTNGISKIIGATLAVAIATCATYAAAQTSVSPPADVSAQRPPAGPPAHRNSSDSALVRDVRRALSRSSGVNSTGIHVTARQGIVTLTGWVPQRSQVERAGSVARSVRGVRSVSNRLTVRTRHGSGS